jgi:hypothetical protein
MERSNLERKILPLPHRIARISSRPLQNLAAALVLLAFMLRSFIPDGFMPDTRAHHAPAGGAPAGIVSLVICTGTGPATIYLPGGQVPGDAPQKPAAPAPHSVPCPFAGAFVHGTLTAVVLPAPALRVENFVEAAAIAAPVPGRFGLYLAQGPPAFS